MFAVLKQVISGALDDERTSRRSRVHPVDMSEVELNQRPSTRVSAVNAGLASYLSLRLSRAASSSPRVAASVGPADGSSMRPGGLLSPHSKSQMDSKRASTPDLLSTLMELTMRETGRQSSSGGDRSPVSPPIRMTQASAPGSNTSRLRSELLHKKPVTVLPLKKPITPSQLLANIERMIHETCGMVTGLKSLQSSLKVWSEMLASLIHQAIVQGGMSSRFKVTPSAAEATLIIDDFVKGEEDRGSNQPDGDLTRMVDDFVKAEEDRVSSQSARGLTPEAARLMVDEFVRGEALDDQDQAPPSPSSRPAAAQLDEGGLEKPFSSPPAPPSQGTSRMRPSRGQVDSSRSVLRSRGWSRLVDTIAQSPGGVQDESAADGGLEIPRTPEDFDKLLKDAGLDLNKIKARGWE